MNKQLGQVFTKKIVADFMVELFNIRKDAQLLDPCFGEGVFIKSALNHGFKNIDGYEIDKELFRSLINEGYSGTNLYNCDFLKSTSNKKYDGVIMNPPYIRHEEIDDLIIYDISKEKLREDIIFKELPKTANLYMYFVIKAFDMLKENGEMIIIFPSTWLTTEGGEYFKRLLFNNYSVVGQYEVFGEPFHRDALVEVSILHVKKTLSTANNIIDKKILNIYDRCIEEYKTQDIKLNFDISFNSYAKIRRGLTTGFNKLYINPEGVSQEFLKPIVSSPKDITGYSTDNAILDYVLM